MRWLMVIAAVWAAPAMAQSPGQCRALDELLSDYIRAERSQIRRDADTRETLLRVMGIVPEAVRPDQVRTRELLDAATDALNDRTHASEQLAKALEDLQHRARMCAR